MKVAIEERFWAKVDKTGGPHACWPWVAYRNPKGYGRFMLRGRSELSHRVAYILTFGAIPEKLHCLHDCDNPPCCNPAHLRPGTNLDNVEDKIAKGRQAAGDSSGMFGKGYLIAGEKNPAAKLTLAQVNEIRQRYKTGGISQRQLAKHFGVGKTIIGSIVRGEKWKPETLILQKDMT